VPFAIVGLGSNVRPRNSLPRAVAMLSAATPLRGVSSAWATVAVGPPGQPDFVNAAVLIDTGSLRDLRELLRGIEARLGRRRTGDRFAPRTVDLDQVLVEAVGPGGERTVSVAPDLLVHAHVAVPAAEVLPQWVHPASGERLSDLAARLTAALPAAERPRRLALSLHG
jgi:2-amino-4-hydroxy-6-hydroxymethyldihydropteridine diphosphokinase